MEDHSSAIWQIINKGEKGETFNVGGENEWENIILINRLCELVANERNKDESYYKKLITYIKIGQVMIKDMRLTVRK